MRTGPDSKFSASALPIRPILVAAACALALAAAGGLLTELGPWYRSLVQPAWKPPDIWFGPAWTLIFTLTAAAGVIGWQRIPYPHARRRMLLLFALNAGLNMLWSLLYFRLQRPDWALMEVGFLWLSIVLLMLHLRRHAPVASALLLPYLVWVSFASALNAAAVQLNGPFGVLAAPLKG